MVIVVVMMVGGDGDSIRFLVFTVGYSNRVISLR